MQTLLKGTKRIVIKVGTSTLTTKQGLLDTPKIIRLVQTISGLKADGFEVALVTSGAIGAGMGVMGLEQRPKTLSQKQAVAAVGQVALTHLYQQLFSYQHHVTGQLLLTKADFADRTRYLNARNVCLTLLSQGIIPIINENDAVVADEIKVGDNDTLSALVSGLVDADVLIILSDIAGLYTANPHRDKTAIFIPKVTEITAEIHAMAGGEGSIFGTGGMKTKITAAEMATKKGAHVIIASGEHPEAIRSFFTIGGRATIFCKQEKKIAPRKYWLAYGAKTDGNIQLDGGAIAAIKSGKSILPAGVIACRGSFVRGSVIEIIDSDADSIAKGISHYSSTEIAAIKGAQSREIEGILGYRYDDEIIHYDNLIILK